MIPWARAGGSFPAETIYLFSVEDVAIVGITCVCLTEFFVI